MRHFIRRLATAAAGMLAIAFSPIASASPEPALFGQRPIIHDAAISPDATQVALLQNYQGQYIVYIVELGASEPSGEPKILTLAAEAKPAFIKWVSNDRVIVSTWQSEMINRTPFNAGFLYTVDVETMDARILIDAGGDGVLRQFNNRVLDWLEDDPDHIIMEFAADGRPQSFPDVRRVRVDNGRHSVIQRRHRDINSLVTDSDGIAKVGVGWRDEGRERFMRIMDPATGEWEGHESFPEIDPETMDVVAIIDGGNTLIMRAYRGQDTLGLHRYDLVNKTFGGTLYQNERFDVGSVILSKDGDTIVGVSFEGETQERVLFDEYDSTYEEALARFDGFDVQFVDQSADSETLILRVSGASDPGGVYLYKRGGGLTRLAEGIEGLSGSDMGEVISVRYTARDGERIPAIVTLPNTIIGSPEAVPFIILPHGGPYARDVKRFDWLAQFFASQGYGVLQMNFRGSEGFGQSFSEAGRESWVIMQDDVEDGMRWLLEKGYADPDRTCIAGWSYGGYAALMGAANDPDLYNCVIAIAALTDIREAIQDARKYTGGRARAERTFGPLMDDRDLLRANSPVERAEDITVPVFMAHGTLDSAVEHDHFTRMKRRLERADVDGTYLSFRDGDHSLTSQADRQEMVEGIADFLMRVNGPSPFAPD